MPLVPAVDDSQSLEVLPCGTVLLPYMPNGEELVMQLVKESSTNYCCPEVTVLPLEGDPGYPQDVTLVALSAAQNTVEHDRLHLHYISYFSPKNEIVSSLCINGLNCHLHLAMQFHLFRAVFPRNCEEIAAY